MTTLVAKVTRVKTFVIKERICEAINAVHFFAWAVTAALDPRFLKLFPGFTAEPWMYASLFSALFVFSIVGMFHNSLCRRIAAVTMSFGAAVWILLSVQFWRSYPPATPWMFYYPFLAFTTYAIAQGIEKECKKWGRCDV